MFSRSLLKRLLESKSYGRKQQLHNLARQDPRLFVASPTTGFSADGAMLKYLHPDQGQIDCGFVTIGVAAAPTNIHQPSVFPSKRSNPSRPQYYRSKALQLIPMRYDWGRTISAAQMLFRFGKNPISDDTRLNCITYKKAPTFGTGVRSAGDRQNQKCTFFGAIAFIIIE